MEVFKEHEKVCSAVAFNLLCSVHQTVFQVTPPLLSYIATPPYLWICYLLIHLSIPIHTFKVHGFD